jgi:hypothetical protein
MRGEVTMLRAVAIGLCLAIGGTPANESLTNHVQ